LLLPSEYDDLAVEHEMLLAVDRGSLRNPIIAVGKWLRSLPGGSSAPEEWPGDQIWSGSGFPFVSGSNGVTRKPRT
jgi:hypothetical protein